MLPVEEVEKKLSDYDQALKFYRDKDYFLAIRSFDKHLEKEPKNVGALKLRAHSKILMGHPAETLDDLKRALKYAPKDPDLLWVCAAAAEALKDYKSVITYCNKGIASNPKKELLTKLNNTLENANNYLDKLKENAYKEHKKGNYSEALKLYTNYLIHIPDDADILAKCGDMYKWLNKPSACITCCDESIHLANKDWRTYFIRGRAKIDLQDFSGALADLEMSRKLNGDYAETYVYLGIAHENLNDFICAIDAFNKALSLDKGSSAAADGLKRVREKIRLLRQEPFKVYQARKYQEAKNLYEDFLTKFPGDSEALKILGDTKKWLGDPDGCIKVCTEAFHLNPKDADILYVRARAKADKKDIEGAINDLSEAISINNKYADCYYYRGDLFEQLNRSEEALKDFEQAIMLDPTHTDAKECAEKIRRKKVEEELKFRKTVKYELIEQQILRKKVELEKILKELDCELSNVTIEKLETLYNRFMILENDANELKNLEYYKLLGHYFTLAARMSTNVFQQEVLYQHAIDSYNQLIKLNPFDKKFLSLIDQLESEKNKLQSSRSDRFAAIRISSENRSYNNATLAQAELPTNLSNVETIKEESVNEQEEINLSLPAPRGKA